MSEKKQNLLQYLPLALIIGGFCVTWGVFSANINAQEEKITELRSDVKVLLEMKQDIAVIKTDISYIKEKIK